MKPKSVFEIAWWLIGKVKPYERNARKLSESAVAKVAQSIETYGWRQPIVVDRKGVIICGHTRLLAAQKLGLKQVPVHVAKDLTEAQAKAYRLMDNRSHQESTWQLTEGGGSIRKEQVHPTQKPVELFVIPIKNHLKAGEVCYEPFAGSGSQVIAAEQTATRCFAMELSPNYVDVIVRRWQTFTGKEATLAATGATFVALSGSRAKAA